MVAQGALAGSKAGAILVDMTTSEPSLAIEIHQAAKAKGVGHTALIQEWVREKLHHA